MQIIDEGTGLTAEVQEHLKHILATKNGDEEVLVDEDKSQSDFFRSLRICKKIVNMNRGEF